MNSTDGGITTHLPDQCSKLMFRSENADTYAFTRERGQNEVTVNQRGRRSSLTLLRLVRRGESPVGALELLQLEGGAMKRSQPSEPKLASHRPWRGHVLEAA